MTIWECAKCKHRYGQRKGEEVSTCPKCKCDERVRLAENYGPPRAMSPNDYFDLWRFARVAEQRFVELLASHGAVEISECPACHAGGFLHRPDCLVSRLCQIEREAIDKGLEAARVNSYACETCSGVIYSVDLNPGITPEFTSCVASMGCVGQMRSSRYEVPDDLNHGLIKWGWYRPADVDKFTKEEHEAVLNRGELLLKRLVPEEVKK